MSDESDDNEDKGKGRGRREPKDKDLATPVIHDKGLVEFLMRLFYGEDGVEPDSYPERIELNAVAGRFCEQLKSAIWTGHYAPSNATEAAIKRGAGAARPKEEQLIALSNRLLEQMQHDCNETGHRTRFGIHAWSAKRGPDPYMRYLKTMEPKGKRSQTEGEGDDGEPMTREQRFLAQMVEEHRKSHEMWAEMMAGLLDRYSRDKDRDAAEIDRLHKRLAEATDQRDRALDHQLDREERRATIALRREAGQAVLSTATMILPPLVASLTGNKVPAIPGQPPVDLEVETLRNFFKLKSEGGQLTVEEAVAAFGDWNEETGEVRSVGVLSKDQSRILIHVATSRAPTDELDKLMPDGELAITTEQAFGLLQIFGQRLMPLQLLIKSRLNRREQAKK